MRLVLLGLPGAGKGTQGERISKKYGIPHISTGSLIRSVIASGSQLGKEVNSYISRGNLIPDEIAIEMVRKRLSEVDCQGGWILDGFPRTVQQAMHLDKVLARSSLSIDFALDIRISEEEAIRRISQRRVCSQCGETYHLTYYQTKVEGICDKCGGKLFQRSDDNQSTAKQRLRVHMAQTHPVVHYYAQSGRLVSIAGERSIEDVFGDVDQTLRNLFVQRNIGEIG